MKRCLLVLLLLAVGLSGCAFLRTPNFIPADSTISYPPTKSIKTLWSPPKEAYKEIGILYVEWGAPGLEWRTIEGKALAALQEKGMAVGAQGLILRPLVPPGGCLSPSYLFRWEAIAIRFE